MANISRLLKMNLVWTVALGLAWAVPVSAQDADAEDAEENGPTIDDVVEDFEKIEGLFTLYRDPETGGLMLEIAADQLGKEFIYTTQSVDGVPYVSFFHVRGAYLSQNIITFKRHYDKIEIIEMPTGLYFEPETAIARAANANVIPATLAVGAIAAMNEEETRFLIDADSIFLSETLQQISPSPNPNQLPTPQPPFSLGHLNSEKTKAKKVRNYPENLDIVVQYSYDNEQPMNYGGAEVADARNVSVTIQHSLLAMPADGYKPRIDDHRVGFFADKVTDMTSHAPTPYRDVINRWRLEKKDPSADVSEPVKPITYWIENTTPLEIRDQVREGILVWNKAFESAGFKNAIQVKVQPDDATWDAGDIRYNVARWISSDQVPYSGYGPSFTNPRTGEILGADIMLNYQTWSYRKTQDHVLDETASTSFTAPAVSQTDHRREFCAAGDAMRQNFLFALAMVDGATTDESVKRELVRESVVSLVAHEVGHTLGLMHNFRASQMLSPEDIHNTELTSEVGIMGSVMDYEIVNIAPTPEEQGHFFFGNIGPYDHWAIEFGYTAELEDSEAEAERSKAVLARSTEPALAFGNDTDNTFNPGSGIDPRVQTYDMSSDAITYGKERMELVNRRIATLKDDYEVQGDTWHNLRQAYGILNVQKRVAAMSMSRYIGGIYVERANLDQEGALQPYTPVPEDEQKRAMGILAEYIFAPDAHDVPPELFAHMQLQRRGYDFGGGTEDPKIHDQVLRMQAVAIQHLLHPVTMKRLSDSALYGNTYSPTEMVSDLTDAVFKDDLKTSVNSFRQNLQVNYTQALMGISFGMGGHDQISQSAADYNLRRIERMMRQGRRPNEETDAHRRRILSMVEMMLYGQPSR
jgi:hypothetical protein